ncbi:MAG: GYF domain-containing protein [Verrucomicrobiota bacterium]|nr:GYF domain-containing protein [Verrucomicrobiota bacterium]
MQIFVGKNGQQLGPFSLEEVNRKLADGTFAASDLAWYEGAAAWAPLSSVAGVVAPPAATATLAPAPVPPAAPKPSPVAPAPGALRPNASIVQPAQPARSTKILGVISWLLIGITLVISFIPFLGCGAWVLVWPVAIAAIVMGIIVIVRGAVAKGALIILAAILLVPISLFGPVYTTGVAIGAVERRQENQILENLRQIDSAKTKWAADTKASTGTPVTMANLTSQLGGKEIKPAIDETYDPMPVGQPPTATIPTNKTLGPFSGGDVVTAASMEKALANGSVFNWNMKRNNGTTLFSSTPAPQSSPSPTTGPSVTASPKPSPSPSPSPRSSASPKSSSSPHSLISPRQNVEPEDSPSTGPSPSAKFGPRTTPRRSAPPSSEKPDSESSGGLKQGRKKPRESPDTTPAPSPNDDAE